MAKFVLTDASVTLNSVDLSDHVASVTLDITADEIVTTAMGDTFQSRAMDRDWETNFANVNSFQT